MSDVRHINRFDFTVEGEPMHAFGSTLEHAMHSSGLTDKFELVDEGSVTETRVIHPEDQWRQIQAEKKQALKRLKQFDADGITEDNLVDVVKDIVKGLGVYNG